MSGGMSPVSGARRSPPAARTLPPAERRPFRDNPRLILLGIVLLFGALAVMVFLADKSTQLNPDFLSEVVLYALSAADLTMVLALTGPRRVPRIAPGGRNVGNAERVASVIAGSALAIL